jgi:hypothetical protein
MNFNAVTLGRKQYETARVVMKLEKLLTWSGGAPLGCGMSNTLSAGSLVPMITSYALGFSRTAPTNSASFTQCLSMNSYWFSMWALVKKPRSPRSIPSSGWSGTYLGP